MSRYEKYVEELEQGFILHSLCYYFKTCLLTNDHTTVSKLNFMIGSDCVVERAESLLYSIFMFNLITMMPIYFALAKICFV